jgi:eukaryotic-like serine/threonine-protein kinase
VPSPGDSEPGPAPTLPPRSSAGTNLWDAADLRLMRGPPPGFADADESKHGDGSAATIGHIGRYALKYRLGEGGIGTVFAAHDPLLSRLIAVKTLHVEVDESERESFNALFLNEARAAAGLSHPNIVTVFDAGISDDRAYIAMELLKGRDLRQLRQEGWRATPAQAALIVRRVADALGYAHSKGVVHRDVKPANIFMSGRSQPKVLDFGIARIAHQQEAQQTGDIAAGSPYYMAPEQARHEPVDRRADVFSLGVVLYELLTDLKPFRGNTLDEITTAVLEHDPPAANVVAPAVPEALAQITAKALAKSPDHRYRSARAFSRELRHWLDENTTAADIDAPIDAAQRPGRAKSIALAALSVLAFGAVAWFVWTTQSGGPSATEVAAAASAVQAQASTPAAAAAAAAASVPAVVAAALPEAAASTTVAVSADPVAGAASSASVPVVAALVVAAAEPVIAAPAASVASAAIASMPSQPIAVAATLPVVKDASKDRSKETAKETPKERRAREARERDARLAATAAASAATPVAGGTVRMAISPWGEVEVDGRAAGTSPPLTELVLPPGRHQIVVRNTDLPPFSVTVNVSADQPVTLRHGF